MPEGVSSKEFYKGDKDSLVFALYPLITTPRFIDYSEDTNSKLNKHKIHAHGSLIRAMQPLQSNLAFSRKKIEATLEDIARRRHFFGERDERTLRQWSCVCGQRMRTLFRHFRQAVLKSRGCRSSWVRLVLEPEPPQAPCMAIAEDVAKSCVFFLAPLS